MLVLGIETSCDETGVALYDGGEGRLLAHVVHSQVAMHEAYGGVVPELASRDHIRRLVPLTRRVLGVIDKMIKQRRESIAQFEKAARKDLADAEKAEIQLLSGYLPAQMGEAEIAQAVSAAITESGASGVKDMGKVMALLKPRLAGKADMGKVSALVKTKLGG